MILKSTDKNIKKAAEVIKAGRLVSFPTETVYGLGADAMNPIAAAKIFKAKERPFFDPLIVHVSDPSMVTNLTSEVPELAERLMEKFWPGPLTLVLPKNSSVPEIITSGLETVALRMPSHETALKLIKYADTPVAAPSANRFSCLSPTEAKHVHSQIGESVEIILDSGPCEIGVESTIVKIDRDRAELLRPGGISVEEIENFIEDRLHLPDPESGTEAPGQLPFHYSPSKPLRIVDTISSIEPDSGYLFFGHRGKLNSGKNCRTLSKQGNLTEAAANLFSYLHELEEMNVDKIIAEKITEEGLGKAIMDRLTKASKKF